MRLGRFFVALICLFLSGNDRVLGAAPAPEVIFRGNESFNDAALRMALRFYDVRLEANTDETNANDAAYFLQEFYFTRGFPEATVTYEFFPGRVTLIIEEGRRFFIRNLRIEGAEERLGGISTERLTDIATAAIRTATNAPFGRLRFVEPALQNAGQQMVTLYSQNGFLDAAADFVANEVGVGLMDVVMTVEPGRQYLVPRIRVEGVPPELESEVEKITAAYSGQPFRASKEAICRSALLDTLRNAGFFNAEVTSEAQVDPVSAEVDLVMYLQPGEVYTIGEIRVEGHRQTLRKAILERFGIRSGMRYNASAVNAGARRLWFTGAFSEAEPELFPRSNGILDVLLKLEETRAKTLRGTVGYGQWEQLFGRINYVDRNFLGTLNRLSLEGYISFRSLGVFGTLSDPWFFRSETTGSVGAFFIRREVPAYEATFLGGFLGVEGKANTTDLTGYSLQYIWKSVFNSSIFSEDDGGGDVNYTMAEIRLTQTLDRRNDLVIPMKGYLLRYEAGVASPYLLGEISLFRLLTQATWYQPLMEITPERPLVPFISLNHRAGLILPYGDTEEVPIQERFFLGGADTVRGFQFDGLGPRDKDADPLGGLAFLQFNAEFQFPLFRSLFAAVFSDIGNLAPEIQDFDFDETRVTVGAGLRFYTPLGALRVDYGYNAIREPGDPLGAWQFGFGFTF